MAFPHSFLMISLPYSIRNRTETLGPREQSRPADMEVERSRFWNSAAAAVLEYPLSLLTESRKSGRRADIGSAGSSCPVCVPSILHVCFSGHCHERFGENMFCHFALKVPHVFWMLSFDTQLGIPSGCPERTEHGFSNQSGLDLNLSSAAFQGCCP